MSNTIGIIAARLIVSLVAIQVLTVEGFESRKCPRFNIKKSTIIKAKASEANGAVYLGSSKSGATSRHCHDLCCETENCNLVLLKRLIYNERVDCYLFNCGSPSKCLFHAHSTFENYVALQFDDERDVAPEFSPATTQPTEVPETEDFPTTPYMDHNRTKEYHWQSKVAKTTEDSRHWNHETSTPYHESDHTVKTNNEGNLSEKKLGEITTSHDSSKDGFASMNQKPSIHNSFVTTKAPVASLDWRQGTQKETLSSHQGYDGSETSFDHSHKESDHEKVNPDTFKHPKAKIPEDDGSFGKDPEEESYERRVWIDKNPDYPGEPKQPVHTNKPMATNTPTKVSTKNLETQNSIIINKFNIRQNKAVIPLAVALIIALLLLMAIVFRMRTSRRRRTKAFLTDDADYLINGMYL